MGRINYHDTSNRHPLDFYPTPPEFTRVLLSHWDITGLTVHEPCCGDGSMSRILEEAGARVIASDLEPRGHGTQADMHEIGQVDYLITNPPYKDITYHIAHLLPKVDKKMALLLRLNILEGQSRYHGIWSQDPPADVIVIPWRMKVQGKTSQFPHCWVIWDKDRKYSTRLHWAERGDT